MCIHCLGHFSSLSPAHPHLPHTSIISRQNAFCHLLQFCWREDISNKKKDILFSLVWGKDSYTERFLTWLPCTSVLQPELIHLYLTSSLLPGHLPIVTSVILRLLYYLLYNTSNTFKFWVSYLSLFFMYLFSS
jgi:hypothetical protein